MNIVINDNDFYNKNISIPKKIDSDLMNCDFFKIPEMTFCLNTIDGRWINGFFMIADPKYKGVFLKTSETKFRIMLGIEFEPFLYRGENSNKYSYFQPSLHRESGISRCVE